MWRRITSSRSASVAPGFRLLDSFFSVSVFSFRYAANSSFNRASWSAGFASSPRPIHATNRNAISPPT